MNTLNCPRCGSSVGNAIRATCSAGHAPTLMVPSTSTATR